MSDPYLMVVETDKWGGCQGTVVLYEHEGAEPVTVASFSANELHGWIETHRWAARLGVAGAREYLVWDAMKQGPARDAQHEVWAKMVKRTYFRVPADPELRRAQRYP